MTASSSSSGIGEASCPKKAKSFFAVPITKKNEDLLFFINLIVSSMRLSTHHTVHNSILSFVKHFRLENVCHACF